MSTHASPTRHRPGRQPGRQGGSGGLRLVLLAILGASACALAAFLLLADHEPSALDAEFGAELGEQQLRDLEAGSQQGAASGAVAIPAQERLYLIGNQLARRVARNRGNLTTLSDESRHLYHLIRYGASAGMAGFEPGDNAYAGIRAGLIDAFRAIGRTDLAGLLAAGADAKAEEAARLRARWIMQWTPVASEAAQSAYLEAHLDSILKDLKP